MDIDLKKIFSPFYFFCLLAVALLSQLFVLLVVYTAGWKGKIGEKLLNAGFHSLILAWTFYFLSEKKRKLWFYFLSFFIVFLIDLAIIFCLK